MIDIKIIHDICKSTNCLDCPFYGTVDARCFIDCKPCGWDIAYLEMKYEEYIKKNKDYLNICGCGNCAHEIGEINCNPFAAWPCPDYIDRIIKNKKES